MEMKLSYMKYTNFEIRSQTEWLQFYYQKIHSWMKISLYHHVDLHLKFNLCVRIAKCQMLMIMKPYDSWLKRIINGRIWMLGSKLVVVNIIWGLNCFIKNVNVIVIIIIIAPLFCFWIVCPMQGCDDISP